MDSQPRCPFHACLVLMLYCPPAVLAVRSGHRLIVVCTLIRFHRLRPLLAHPFCTNVLAQPVSLSAQLYTARLLYPPLHHPPTRARECSAALFIARGACTATQTPTPECYLMLRARVAPPLQWTSLLHRQRCCGGFVALQRASPAAGSGRHECAKHTSAVSKGLIIRIIASLLSSTCRLCLTVYSQQPAAAAAAAALAIQIPEPLSEVM